MPSGTSVIPLPTANTWNGLSGNAIKTIKKHCITAFGAATVGEVHFAAGDRVDTGELLVSLEPLD